MCHLYHGEKFPSPNIKSHAIAAPGLTFQAAPGRWFGDCGGEEWTHRKLRADTVTECRAWGCGSGLGKGLWSQTDARCRPGVPPSSVTPGVASFSLSLRWSSKGKECPCKDGS